MLPNFISTAEDLETFLKRLRVFLNYAYNLKFSTEEALNNTFSSEEKKFLEYQCRKSGEDLTKVVKKIEQKLNNTPVLSITLAFKPTVNQENSLIQSIKKEAKNTVVKIYYNPSISGGAIFEYKGKFLDLSLKHRYETRL